MPTRIGRILTLPLVGLILIGLVSSGLLDLFPLSIRVAVVILLFSLVPGEILRRRLGYSYVGACLGIAMGFFLGLGVFVFLGAISRLVGLSYSEYRVLLQFGSFAFFGLFFIIGPATGAINPQAGGWTNRKRLGNVIGVVAACLVACVLVIAPPSIGERGSDYQQIGSIRSIVADNSLTSLGVLAADRDGPTTDQADPAYGMLDPLLAAGAEFADVDAAQMWQAVQVSVAVVGVLVFCATAIVLAPTTGCIALAVLLFLFFDNRFGPGLFAAHAYDTPLALVISWLLFVVAIAYAREPANRRLVGFALLLVAGALIRLDVAVFFLLPLVSIVVFHRVFAIDRHAMLKLGLTSIACFLIIAVWRIVIYPRPALPLAAVPSGVLYFGGSLGALFVPAPGALTNTFGVLFVAAVCLVPVLVAMWKDNVHVRMAVALSLPPVLLVFNPWVFPWIYRWGMDPSFAMLGNIPVWIITALVLGALVTWARRGSVAKKVIAILLLFCWGKLLVADVDSHAAQSRSRERNADPAAVSAMLAFVNASVPAASVVLTDPQTGSELMAFCDVRVVSLSDRLLRRLDRADLTRAEAARDVLSIYATQSEARAALERFGVSYVILNGAAPKARNGYLSGWDPAWVDTAKRKLGVFSDRSEPIYNKDRVVIYKIDLEKTPEDATWFPDLLYTRAEGSALTPCPRDVGGAVVVIGAAVIPSPARAGDPVDLVVAYNREDQPPPWMEPVLHVCLEQEQYFDRHRPYPGDRYVRILAEKRSGRVQYCVDREAFDGLYPPELWPIGKSVYDTLSVTLPSDLRAGTYRVRIALEWRAGRHNVGVKTWLFDSPLRGISHCVETEIQRSLSP